MNGLSKFGGADLDSAKEFTYPKVWEREEHPGWCRLRIGASHRQIPLILALCRQCNGPFGVLYVLVVSRLGREEARYQNPAPSTFDELELFLYTFQEFFEQDGRHHLWVSSLGDRDQFVFDNHNVIYAYGDLDRIARHLQASGFERGIVDIPSPHVHNYHPQFDKSEDELFEYWQWIKSPLRESDNP